MKYNYLFEQYRKNPKPYQNLLVQCERKWGLFGDDVDFKNKTVLDIGCAEGHSCIEAWQRGASYVLGVEGERGWTTTGERVKEHLKIIIDAVEFTEKRWEYVNLENREFNIVIALGLLHHIPVGQYEDLLRKMCCVCNETLVLENRVDVVELKKSYIRAEFKSEPSITVSVPSAKYLIDTLDRFGFVVKKTYVINAKAREIWVCKRETNDGR